MPNLAPATKEAEAAPVLVDIDDLPAETIEDILLTLQQGVPAFAGARESHIRSEILGLDDPVVVVRQFKDPGRLDAGVRSTSSAAVSAYAARDGATAPPVVTDGERVLEGGHRLAAALKRGDAVIDTVDVGALLRADWASWLEGGDKQATDPVRSNVGLATTARAAMRPHTS